MRHFKAALCCIMIFLVATGCKKTFELKYYDSGTLKSKTEIKNGVKDGEVFRYYESGALMARGNMRSGQQEGKLEWFYDSGELEEVDFYVDDELDGPVTKYYKHGQVRSTSMYKHGKRIGQQTRFSVDGSIAELSFYDSLGNLYYLSIWDSPKHRKMQAFMPIFSVDVKNDSIYLSARSIINIRGTAHLSIGLSNQQHDEISVLARIDLNGTARKTTVILNNVDVDVLFYKIEFIPTESDSIKGFEFIQRIRESESPTDAPKSI